MRRSVLLTLAVLGVLVSLVGGVGLFAALTDTATTGTLTADSGGLAGSADLKMTTATVVDVNQDGIVGNPGDSINCFAPGYSDNLATDPQTANVSPGFASDKLYFCIKNVGSQPVTLTFDAFEMIDVELDCTGDEALVDGSCGIVGGVAGVGELSGVLSVQVDWYAQCDAAFNEPSSRVLGSLTSTPLALQHGLSAGGGADCYSLTLAYPSGGANTPQMIQQAQSDRVTWRFRFNAAA
jgi:hypothetical protein